MNSKSKVCTKCGKLKLLAGFAKRPSVPDGRSSWCKICRSADRAVYTKRSHDRDREAFLKADRTYKRIKRIKLLTLYGSKCECCKVGDFEFLCIDHVNNDGAQERRLLRGYQIYSKLLKAGVRLPGYRILCHNCNFAIGVYGFCPHNNLPTQLPMFEWRMKGKPIVPSADLASIDQSKPDLPSPR
jgi:hypothetical protein